MNYERYGPSLLGDIYTFTDIREGVLFYFNIALIRILFIPLVLVSIVIV